MKRESDNESEKTFGEDLGSFTVERLNNRLDRMKTIIDANDFALCKGKRIKDAWEALIEVVDILAAGLIIQAKRTTAISTPKTTQDRIWAIIERSPLSAALIFLGVVLLKISGHGDIVNILTKGH